jgi:hypothetical protein
MQVCTEGNQDSTVELMPRLQAEQQRKHGLILSKDEIFLFTKMSGMTSASAQPLIQWLIVAVSPWVKQLGQEANYSLPSNARVKNELI